MSINSQLKISKKTLRRSRAQTGNQNTPLRRVNSHGVERRTEADRCEIMNFPVQIL